MKCVIIGGGGFIGRHLGNALTARNCTVTAYDVTQANPDFPVNFDITLLNIAHDSPKIPTGTDVVFYLAQSPHYRDFPRHADHLFAVNVVGAVHTAERACAAGARLFCYASTGTVYQPSFQAMNEEHPVRRDQPYALSKLYAEEALSLFEDRLTICCPRLFGVFGPYQTGMLVQNIAARITNAQPITIQPGENDSNDPRGLRISLTFVDDLITCLLALCDRSLSGSHVPRLVNVASDCSVDIRQLADSLATQLGRTAQFEVAHSPRESDYIADIGLLRTLIDVTFTPVDDAIAQTVQVHV